jgi:lysine 2,3-aminomutase
VVPVGGEYIRTPGEVDDPLGEDGDGPVPGLVHRYPDRVLFLVAHFYSTYCRYCTRSRMVGPVGERSLKKSDVERAIDYIAATPTIVTC